MAVEIQSHNVFNTSFKDDDSSTFRQILTFGVDLAKTADDKLRIVLNGKYREKSFWCHQDGLGICGPHIFLQFDVPTTQLTWFYAFMQITLNRDGKQGWLCDYENHSKGETYNDFRQNIEDYMVLKHDGHRTTKHHATLVERTPKLPKSVPKHISLLTKAHWLSTYRDRKCKKREQDIFDLIFVEKAIVQQEKTICVPTRDCIHYASGGEELFFVRCDTARTAGKMRFYAFQRLRQDQIWGRNSFLCQRSEAVRSKTTRTLLSFMLDFLQEYTGQSNSVKANSYHIEVEMIYADAPTGTEDGDEHTESSTPRIYEQTR